MTAPTSTEGGSIFDLLPLVMSEVGGIGKHGYNEAQGYAFMSYGDVAAACQTAFAKHGISVSTEVLDMVREEHTTKSGGTMHVSLLTIAHTFSAPDGSNVSGTIIGEGADSGDKATNKAHTAAMKYALRTLLVIPDAEDGDAASPEATVGIPQAQRRAQPRQRTATTSSGSGPSDEQKSYITSLIDQKEIGSLSEPLPNVDAISRTEASAWIEKLSALPDLPKAHRAGTVAEAVAQIANQS